VWNFGFHFSLPLVGTGASVYDATAVAAQFKKLLDHPASVNQPILQIMMDPVPAEIARAGT
jgi:hypothetical protein